MRAHSRTSCLGFRFTRRSRIAVSVASVLQVCLLVVASGFPCYPSYASEQKEVELVWRLSPEEDVEGYRIYYDTISRHGKTFTEYRFSETLQEGDYEVDDTIATYRLGPLDSMTVYWVSVTAYDYAGNESDFSNEMIVFPSNIPGCTTVRHSYVVSPMDLIAWSFPLWSPFFWTLIVRRLAKVRKSV